MKTSVPTILGLIQQGKNDHEIKVIAVSLMNGKSVERNDDYGAIQVIYGYVKRYIRFIQDTPEVDITQPAMVTIQRHYGDCEDQTIVVASLLRVLGIPVKIVFVSNEGPEFTHVFARAAYPISEPLNWVSLDTTIKTPIGSEIPSIKSKVYEVR